MGPWTMIWIYKLTIHLWMRYQFSSSSDCLEPVTSSGSWSQAEGYHGACHGGIDPMGLAKSMDRSPDHPSCEWNAWGCHHCKHCKRWVWVRTGGVSENLGKWLEIENWRTVWMKIVCVWGGVYLSVCLYAMFNLICLHSLFVLHACASALQVVSVCFIGVEFNPCLPGTWS